MTRERRREDYRGGKGWLRDGRRRRAEVVTARRRNWATWDGLQQLLRDSLNSDVMAVIMKYVHIWAHPELWSLPNRLTFHRNLMSAEERLGWAGPQLRPNMAAGIFLDSDGFVENQREPPNIRPIRRSTDQYKIRTAIINREMDWGLQALYNLLSFY